ncbi:copper chaperone [Sorochytrium milnesiophthora]
MTCDSCATSVRKALQSLHGLESVDIDVAEKRVVVRASDPPSAVLRALKSTHLDTVARGVGPTGLNHSAVAIFEATNLAHDPSRPYGLARIVQLAPDHPRAMVDVTLAQLPAGEYGVRVTEIGDLSEGCAGVAESDTVAQVGEFRVTDSGRGVLVAECPVNVWDIVGRGMCIQRLRTAASNNDGQVTSLCGIVARSAGVFDNTKLVCACSGKTLWEEQMGWVTGDADATKVKL